jgi:uncharacterized protein YodC (DUF2158 family)
MNLTIGDTVRLKSGGPCMTICTMNPPFSTPDTVSCRWYSSHDGKYRLDYFSLSTLEKRTPESQHLK